MIRTTTTRVSTLLALLTALLAPGLLHAAGGDLNWAYNETLPAKQETRAAAFDSAGNTILVGVDDEGAASDWFVAKIAANGLDLSWPTRSFDLSGGIDVATAVVIDGNDDILVTGYGHNGANYDIQTIKYAGSDGTIIWQHTYNGTAGGDDIATAIGIDASNNVYVGGYVQGSNGKDDFIVIKYQASGPVNDAPLWSTPLNGSADGHDRLMALAVNGSSLAVTGESESATVNDFDFMTHKLNLDGTFAWAGPRTYSDTGNGKGMGVAIDSIGNVIATGYVDDGARAMYTIRYAAGDGTPDWVMHKSGETIEGGVALAIDANDDVFVTGTSHSLSTAYDVYTVKYQGADPVGGIPVLLWEDSYNTTNGNHDIGLALAYDTGGDVFVVAYSNDASGGYDDILTLKYCGDDGARLWPQTLYDLEGLHNRPVGVGIGPSGTVLVGGWADTAANGYDLLVLSYDPGAIDPPTDLTASTLTNTEVQLSWTDNSEPPRAEDNFVVERRAESEGSFTVIATLGANVTSYTSTGLTPDLRYYFRVKATSDASGNSAYSNIADARTTVISYTAPTWLHRYAGADAGDDDPSGIATGADQHPVVTGASFALEGGYDYLTLKLDRSDAAIEQWQARYNDGDNEGDTAMSVVVDSQNRVVVTGYSSLYGGGASNTNDIYTIGYPASGPPATWDDQYNGPSGNDDKSSAVAVATDGSDNTAVVGYGKNAAFDNDIYVLKYAADGTRLWAATPYDGGDEDYPTAVAFDAAGNVFVAGRSFNGTDDDWFVARYAATDGSRTHLAPLHAFSGNGNDYAEAIAVDAAGDVYVTGYAFNGSSGDLYTVKYAGSDLGILWQQAVDGGGYDHGAAIGIDPVNGDILVAGTSFYGPGNHDFRLIRYRPAGLAGSGDPVWDHRVDLSGTDDSVTAMAIDRSGVATLTGSSDDDILSVKIDHTETIVGANVFNGSADDVDYPAAVAVNRHGEAFVAGSSMNADAVPNTDYVVFMVDGAILPAPTPLTATQLYAEVSLSWTDNDLDGTGFRLERKLDGCASTEPWVPVGSFAAAVTGHVDTPVNDNTTYCYRVQSFSVSDSSRWVELEVTTADPVAPSGLAAALVSDTEIELTWTDNTTDATGYDFHIERCAGASCTFAGADLFVVSAASVTDPATGTASWLDSTACSGQPYRYRVLADKPGLWTSLFSAPTEAAGVTPIAPLAPSGLSADRVSETLVDLAWTDNSDGETNFLVERCDGDAASCSAGPFSLIGTLPTIAGNVLLLRMDEASWTGTPGEVIDRSGSTAHGTATGVDTTTYGRYARGGDFTGGHQKISTPLVIDQTADGPGATLTAWVKPTAGNDDFKLFSTDDGGYDWGLQHNGATWQIATGDDSGLLETGVAVDAGSWQHIAARFDPAAGVTLFKNGSEAFADPTIDVDASTRPLTIGLDDNPATALLRLPMDEAAWVNDTADVLDASGNGNHGTSRSGAATVAAGRFARAGLFDGTSGYLTTPLVLDQTAGGPGATIEAWVYPTDTNNGWRYLFSTDNGGSDWGLLQYGTSWRVSDGNNWTYTGHSADRDQWQHLLVVYDPASGVTVYKNGVASSTFTIGFDSSTAPFTIGRHATSSSYFFNGLVDEVVVHNRPLSATEAVQRYRQSAFAGTIDEVAVFNRPLSAPEVSTLAQHGVARFTDGTITVNSDYTYRVSADKPGGCGSDWPTATTAPLSVTTSPVGPDLSATVDDLGRVQLDWVSQTTTQTGFRVERCEGVSCSGFTTLDDTLGAGARSYLDSTPCSGMTYRYRVVALQNPGWSESSPSNIADALIPALQAPGGLTSGAVSEGHIVLTWSDPTALATGFQIGRCDTGSSACDQDSHFQPTQSGTGLPEGNRLLLHMDEPAWVNGSADVLDASGNGNHGTSYNGAQPVQPGYFGNAGSFDGTDNYIATPLNLDQTATGPGASFEAWVYPTDLASTDRCVICTDNGYYDWGLMQYGGAWRISNGAARLNTNLGVDLNQWQHLVAVFDPAVGVVVYKNGVASATYAIDFEDNTGNVTIGRYVASNSYRYLGRIDEVAVYDRPLTAQEVQDRYAGQKTFTAGILTPTTGYTFRVWPERNDPCSSVGPYAETGIVTTDAVLAPTGLTATDVGTTRVDLSWTVETTSETGLRLERCAGTGTACDEDAEFTDFGTEVLLPPGTARYTDLTPCAETAYTYRLRAERDAAPLWQSSWTTVGRAAQTLPLPTVLTATGISESEIRVDWSDTTADETEFLLERCAGTDFSCGSPTLVKTEAAARLLYHMDEATWVNGSADVLDSGSDGLHGTSYNGAGTIAEGYYARGGWFDGSNDYLVTPLALDQAQTGPGATLQAWVYPTIVDTTWRNVISTEDGGNDWGLLHYNGLWYVATGEGWRSTGIAVDPDQWQHVAASFTPGVGITFYKNGAATPLSAAYIGYDGTSNPVTIGRQANSSYYFAGRIDEVAVYDRPLDAATILQSYQQKLYEYTDSGLTPGNDYTYRLTVRKTVAGGCDWSVSATATAATLAPPAPELFSVTAKGTTSVNLAWQDKSGSETVYQLQRCDDTQLNCGTLDANFTALAVDLPADTESYDDLTPCPGTTYTYRVRAQKLPLVPDGWETAWVYLEVDTDAVAELSNFNVNRISEVRVDLSWDDANGDEDGFKVERCTGSGCSGFVEIATVVSGDPTVTFADDELQPGLTYNYRVKAYKVADCAGGWETGYIGPQQTAASIVAPTLVSAVEQSTTRIDLDWLNNAPTATGTVIERCNDHPCADAFTPIGTAPIGATRFADTTVCQGSTYSYRIKSVGEGLSQAGGGCWTRRADVVLGSFAAQSVYELEIARDDDMRSDFGDLRFYDETAKRELPYWIQSVADAGQPTAQATVLLLTGNNDTLSLYYGNPTATGTGRQDAFVSFRDDFAGSQIDASDWIELDSNDYITQDDGLHLQDLIASYSWSSKLISTATFDRGDGLELFADIHIAEDTDGVNYFLVGWEQNQTSSVSYSLSAHGLYWSNSYLRAYEGSTQINPSPSKTYTRSTDYQIRIVPQAGGAHYFIRGGTYPDWTLVIDSTGNASRYTGSPLRAVVLQASHKATIKQLMVRRAIETTTTALGVEQDLGGSCYSHDYLWESGYSTEDTWETTRTAQVPTLDSAVALSDSQVDLTWTNNSDPDAAFRIERCCASGCTFAFLADTAPGADRFSDLSTPSSSHCSYRVSALKDTGTCTWTVGPSNVLAADTYPAAAVGLSATAENSRMIRLNWIDIAFDEDGFDIEVQKGNGAFQSTATVGANIDFHYDGRNIEPEQTYIYRIRSFRRVGLVPPYSYEWSNYSYSNPVTTPAYVEGDATCVP